MSFPLAHIRLAPPDLINSAISWVTSTQLFRPRTFFRILRNEKIDIVVDKNIAPDLCGFQI